MAALADCYGEHERGGIEDEGSETFMDEFDDCAGFYSDEENDYNRPNDGRCSPEIPLVDKLPRKLPAKSFYRSTTAQLGDSSETALPRDTTHGGKSHKKRVSDTVTMSRMDGLGDSSGRSKVTLGQTPSRQQRIYRRSKDGSLSRPKKHVKHLPSSSEESSDDETLPRKDETKRKKKRITEDTDDETDVQDTLKEMKKMLQVLCEKVEQNEKCLKEIKTLRGPPDTPSSSSSESKSSYKKPEIPLIVRQEVRKTYWTLCEDDENFGWHLAPGASIKSPENQAVMRILLKEVIGMNPSFEAHDIREAAYRFYKSKSEKESLQRNGKAETKRTSKRRHERVSRKKKEREAALMMNNKLTEEQRTKWLAVVKNELMSSEESDEGDAIVVHPLPWRSEYVNKMFQKIDEYCFSKKSPQAKRQTKKWITGSPSRCPIPATKEPIWAFKKAGGGRD